MSLTKFHKFWDLLTKWGTALYTRFFQNVSLLKVNGGTPSMHPYMVPFERALYLEVVDQLLLSPFEFKIILRFEKFPLNKQVS